ncbi:MAG: glycine oxidase ThiO [Pirellulaceae bacterium]
MHDCLIVGGGVIGLSLAYELAQHGLRVQLLERGRLGREASWAGAGILPPAAAETAAHPLEQLRALSYRLHPIWAARLKEETGIDNGFRRCGGVYLARKVGEAASLHAAHGLWREEQIDSRRLTPQELAQLEPALAPLAQSGRLRAAYHLPGEMQIRNPHHLQALARACADRGVDLQENVEVVGFRRERGRITHVETNRDAFPVSRLCITSGAWTRLLLEKLSQPNDILPIRGQMILYRCPTKPFTHVINEGPRYLVPRDDGRVLAGSTEEEVGYDKSTTEEGLAELRLFAGELIAELTPGRIEQSWAGLRPGSIDGFPYLGPLPEFDNAYVAAGHFRSGLYMSPGTAVVLGQVVRGIAPEVDLTPFRPR